MELKDFQKSALDTLAACLNRTRITGNPEQAFRESLRTENPRPYRTIPNLAGVPNLCLRLPTGAGKTLLAAHTIAVAGRNYLERDYPVVLWLVPTSTIRKQTAEALKKPSHPYRAAIDNAFDGRVSVFDISDIEQIRPQDLTERVCIIVVTIQSLRTSNPDGRRAYSHSEHFEPHFTHIPANAPELERNEEGKLKFSFVNLMAFHRPLVLVDEAHKAGTNLSFEMLASLRPSCIVEFTATPNTDPKNGSNILFRASAAEVKAAEMIKLPIILTEHPDWRAAVHDALETRGKLAETAKSDPSYIRPLVLFQAQDKGQEVTVEVLKQYLIENENILPEKIAVATGEQRELDTINLFDPLCPVECIITIEALKEGWDCSFAYVLCSVANIGSATDIEQLLGRILRMPYAKSRPNEALNRAYTHVSSPRFGEGARALTGTLVQKMGFEPDEASTMVISRQLPLPGLESTTISYSSEPVLLMTMESSPDLTGLPLLVAERIQVATQPDGSITVSLQGDISQEVEERLLAAAHPEQREAYRVSVNRHRITHRNSLAPVERGEKFAVPRLLLNIQGELEFPEEKLILELGGWRLTDYPAELTPAEFSVKETAERWEVDVQGEQVVYKHLDQSRQLEIGTLKLDWTELTLSRWLEKECRNIDITQPVLLEFCRKVVASLVERRNIPLHDLLRFKFQLAKVTAQKITACRQQAYTRGYQSLLFAPDTADISVETSFADGISFDALPYPAAWAYTGRYQFKKHFFGTVGELKSEGEEFDCAQLLDHLPQVHFWIRNLSGRPKSSFWLPTSTDRFYPDFVALLHDGRILVVEYKGADRVTTDDTKEKRNIGEFWASKSGGKGLFVMGEKRNAQGLSLAEQIARVVG